MSDQMYITIYLFRQTFNIVPPNNTLFEAPGFDNILTYTSQEMSAHY